MEITSTKPSKVILDTNFVEKVLKPYRKDACYLKEAVFYFDEKGNYHTLKGDFAIDESCYIDDTGHFNAVEFNICFNQLGYTLVGYCIKEGLIPELQDFSKNDCDDFFKKQLSHFLIVKIQSSYRKPINAKKFYGEVSIKRISKKANFTFLEFNCKYYDDGDGKSFGEVTTAILHS